MPRLPQPGSDADNWGALLNDFLRVAHNDDGTLRCAPIDVLSFGTVDRGGVIGYRHEGTIQAALDAVGTDEQMLCLSEGNWYIQANFTIPINITLSIMRGAVLKLDDARIVQIGGRIEAGIYRIFDYPDSATVVWSYSDAQRGSRQTVYPEWWGAIASTYHDKSYGSANTTAFNRMFSLDTGGNTHPYVAQLQPGAVYHVADTLYIRGWFHVLGERAQITSSMDTLDTAVVQIGSRAESTKVFYMEWRGVSLTYLGTAPSRSTGILIDHSDFGVFTNCSIGGWDVGIKSGIGSVNEWTFRNILVGACRIGYAMGQRPTDAPPAVSTWEGGKIQQCTELGMYFVNMTQFELRSLDFSLNAQGSIKLENCAAFRISIYTEAVGFTPQVPQGTPNNNWKNIHLIGCTDWQIDHCALLMGAANGLETSAPAYGIYVEGQSRSGHITSTMFVRPRKAAIYIGPACQNITESNNEQRDKVGEQPGSLAVIDESAEGDLIRLTGGIHEYGRRIPNRVARLQNFVVASHNFTDSSWTTSTGATPVTVTGTTLGPDGVTPAQVLNFATSSPVVACETLSLSIPALEGKTIILEWFHKLIELDPSPPGLGFPKLRVLLYRLGTTGSNASQTTTGGLYRIGQPGTDWIFNRRQWTIPPGFLVNAAEPNEPLRIIITNQDINETYRLSIAGICLRVKGESACYYPKFERTGAIDRPGTGHALPGIQVLAYGGQAIRLLVAENSPAVLNLSPLTVGASRWEVGDRCFNSIPTLGGVSGWVCITAGNPGVWKGFGTIEA